MALNQGTPGAPRSWKKQEGPSPEPVEGAGPADTCRRLRPQNREKTHPRCFKLPVCGTYSSSKNLI